MFGNDSEDGRGIVELSRRNALKLAGTLGVGGVLQSNGSVDADVPSSVGSSFEVLSGAAATESGSDPAWISMSNRIDDKFGPDVRFKMNHTLSFFGYSKEAYGDPTDGDGKSWQLTFGFRSTGMNLTRKTIDGTETWQVEHDPNLPKFGWNEVSLYPESNGDHVAISVRRDPELYGFIAGASAARRLAEKIRENPERGNGLGVDPEAYSGNLSRMKRALERKREFQNDVYQSVMGLIGLGLGALSLAIPVINVGAGTLWGILTTGWSIFKDNHDTNAPEQFNKGFKHREKFPQLSPIAGHWLMFDVYVSANATETSVVQLNSKFDYGKYKPHRTWNIHIDATGEEPVVTPYGADWNDPFTRRDSAGPWREDPKPAIKPVPAEKGPDFTKGKEVTFDASDSAYGSHPIARYEWVVELRRELQGRSDQWKQVSEGEGPRLVHRFKAEGTYRVRLTLTDEADQSVTLTEEYVVGNAGDIEADFAMTMDLSCRDRQVGSGHDVEQGSSVHLEVTEPTETVGIESYRWRVVNQDTGRKLLEKRTDDREITWTPPATSGDYVASVRLLVELEQGATRVSKTVTAVEDINEPPRPAFDLAKVTKSGEEKPASDTITAGSELELDASPSKPCDGTIESYEWEIYTDSRSVPQTREGEIATWPVNVPRGTDVRIVLTVRDEKGATATAEETLVVVGIIDDFEDGDLSKYDYTANGAGIRTDLTYEGTYALELPARGGSTADGQCVSVSGDIPYPSRGDSFGGYLYQPDSSNQFRLVFAAQGANKDPDGYNVGVSGGRDFVIEVDRRGKELASTSLSGHTGRWLKLVVDWDYEAETDTTTITATLYDKGPDGTENNGIIEQIQGSESPSTYESGGLAFNADAKGSSMAFDNARFF